MLDNRDHVLYLGQIDQAPPQAKIISLDVAFDGAVKLSVKRTDSGVAILFGDELVEENNLTITVSDEYFQAWLVLYCEENKLQYKDGSI